MAFLDDLSKVVVLANETEDRDRGEQAALRRVAKWVDRRWNARVVTNERWRHSTSRLEELVNGREPPTDMDPLPFDNVPVKDTSPL
jgi:hypothetical protein